MITNLLTHHLARFEMSHEEEAFFKDEYTKYALTFVSYAAVSETAVTILSKQDWLQSINEEYKKQMEHLVHKSQGVTSIRLPTKREWFAMNRNITFTSSSLSTSVGQPKQTPKVACTDNTVISPRAHDADVADGISRDPPGAYTHGSITIASVQRAANEATAAIGTSASQEVPQQRATEHGYDSGPQELTKLNEYQTLIDPFTSPTLTVLIKDQENNNNIVSSNGKPAKTTGHISALMTEESTTDYAETVTHEPLTLFFLQLFNLYKVSTAKIDMPNHLSVDYLQSLEGSIKEEVYNIIKDSRQMKDPTTGEIVIACIDYQDYQRHCGISADCGCALKYLKPHFYYSTAGCPYTEEQIEKMDHSALVKAREEQREKIRLIDCDNNKVS